MIAEHLYNPDIPDCDLVICTSGEQRTSNFLPWEAAYAELDFVPELLPDCGREGLWRSIDHYIHRDRRFGGVKRLGTARWAVPASRPSGYAARVMLSRP